MSTINSIGSMGASNFSPLKDLAEKFSKADTNGDGVLSETEFNATRPQDDKVDFSKDDLFSKIDTDGDGSITETELNDAAEQMQNRMHAFGPPPPPPQDGTEETSSTDSSDTSMQTFKEFLDKIMESAKELRSSATDSGLSDSSISTFVDQIKQYATDYYNGTQSSTSSDTTTSLESFLAAIEKEANSFATSLSSQIALNTKYNQY